MTYVVFYLMLTVVVLGTTLSCCFFFARLQRRMHIKQKRSIYPDLVARQERGASPVDIAEAMLRRELVTMENMTDLYGSSVGIYRPVFSDYYLS